MALTLFEIYRYPIKSTRGHAVSEATMDCFGIAGDRRWMVVDEAGDFVTQRNHAQLALLKATPTNGGLRLSMSGRDTEVAIPATTDERLPVVVWGDTVSAQMADDASNAWLSDQLGMSMRLAYLPDDGQRPVDRDYSDGELVNFADGFPLLVITQSALDALNEKLDAPVPMNRFRPNLVIAGAPAHAEDEWQEIAIGEARVRLVKPCSRCVIPSIDQDTTERDSQINRVLAKYRRRDGQIFFGMNALASAGERFRVGGEVRVLR
ncbi:MAG: MOSC N-terminal beta barrel domain-containing protein [Pseudomonadota bacterium]